MTAPERTWETSRLLAKPAAVADTQIIFDVSGHGGGMQTSKEEKRMQDAVENLVTLFEKGTLNRQQLIQGLLAAMAPVRMVADGQADTSTLSTFRGRSLNHVTLSVTDVERSEEFYSRLLGGTMSRRSIQTDKGARVESATLALPEGFIALFKLGEPKVHHFCVGVENFSIDAALEKLKGDFPESKPITYRGEELYFRDPDGILGQISGMDYRGQLTTA